MRSLSLRLRHAQERRVARFGRPQRHPNNRPTLLLVNTLPMPALLCARLHRLLSLLLLLSCGPSSGVRISPWRAVAHRLSPRLSDRGAALPGTFSPLRGNLMFWKARDEQLLQPTLAPGDLRLRFSSPLLLLSSIRWAAPRCVTSCSVARAAPT